MCRLSGYIGLNCDKQQKLMLILGLAEGIDSRGGHSCGYVSVDKTGDLRYSRKSESWIKSRLKFLEGAASHLCMMHSRYATCGSREDPMNAHPFAIKRDGKVVLWGAHNGMIPGAFESAKNNSRKINVDSQEIFELLADAKYEDIRNLSGYGTITWVHSTYREVVYLARISSQSDMHVVTVKGGGVIWGSTERIVNSACAFADIEIDSAINVDEVGMVYMLHPDGVYYSQLDNICVKSYDRGKKANSYGLYSEYGGMLDLSSEKENKSSVGTSTKLLTP